MKPHPLISCCFRNFWMCPLSKSQDDTKEQSEKAKRSQVIPDSTSHLPKRQNQSKTTEACNPTRLFGHWNWFKTQISSNTLRHLKTRWTVDTGAIEYLWNTATLTNTSIQGARAVRPKSIHQGYQFVKSSALNVRCCLQGKAIYRSIRLLVLTNK